MYVGVRVIDCVDPDWNMIFYFQEKYQSIPDDLGRDINSTQSYLKKHEGFENELIALEAQVP